LRDVLALQSDVARAIAQEIQVKLTASEQVRLATIRQVNPEAYQAYLLGRHHSRKLTEEGLQKGIEYFEQAIAIDPNYALGYAGLASSYETLGGYLGFRSPTEYYPRARAAALKALELDETLAEAHRALALYKLDYEWDWLGAERELKRAIELNPSYAGAHLAYGTYLEALGRFDEAVEQRKRAQELDPLSARIMANVGYPLYYARRHEQAIEYYNRALQLDPNFYWAYLFIGQAYVQMGRYREAIAAIDKAIKLSGGDIRAVATLGHAYAVLGRKAETYNVLEELKRQSKLRYVSPYFIAVIYAGLEEKDRAFEWLETTYAERHPYLALLKVEPVFDPLRSDPRFQSLLRRMNFPE
jgi:tetratricopeptide (TPR) repeat protein